MHRLNFLVGLILVFICIQNGAAQKASFLYKDDLKIIQTIEDTLSTLSYGVINAELADQRVVACHEMIPMLVRALKVENSFKYPFPRLGNVSMQYPADSSFRIFSWQLKISEAEYRYFGAIQINQPTLKLYPLVDRSHNVTDVEYTVLPSNQWYGVVYYNIRSFKTAKGELAYLLFGYDALEATERRKVIDVLTFNGDKANFGLPVFIQGKSNAKSRLVYQYSADASIRVNYDTDVNMIVCDHLMPIQGRLPGQGNTMVPEGSYEGYKYQKGVWKYVEEVFPSGSGANQRAFAKKTNIEEEHTPVLPPQKKKRNKN